MKTSRISSSTLLMLVILVAGCGGRSRTTPPPAVDVTRQAEARKPAKRSEPPAVRGDDVKVPGQDRFYPSEDPRNRPQSNAPALPGSAPRPAGETSATAAPAVEGAPAVEAKSGAQVGQGANAEPGAQTEPGGSGTPATPPAGQPAEPSTRKAPRAAADFAPPTVPAGESRFRVQVFASVSLQTALKTREEVAGVVDEPVFLEREQEVWKVRVGDLSERVAADGIRRRLMGLGYDDAFVVEARGR